MEKAEARCTQAVREQLGPELELTVSRLLGNHTERWLNFVVDPASKSPVLQFGYPTTQPAGLDYIQRSVKLEFGSLTDQRPTERHPVQPWIADTLAEAFADWECSVVAMDLQRSFWEKATILHTEFHRPSDKPTPDRYSRHYADTVALAGHPHGASAIGHTDLRDRVVLWKSRFFRSGWARYDLAEPPTFKVVPPAERQADLRNDYRAMRDMYLTNPPSFDDLLVQLVQLEQRINAA
jgi:hypothetical protein